MALAISRPANPESFNTYALTVTARNEGTAAATGVVVGVPLEQGTGAVFTGGNEFTASQGSYSPYGRQRWTVGTLAPGAEATLTLNLYRLSGDLPARYAQVLAQNEPDADSTPGNGTPPTVNEDDEASTADPSDGGDELTNLTAGLLHFRTDPALATGSVPYRYEFNNATLVPVTERFAVVAYVSDDRTLSPDDLPVDTAFYDGFPATKGLREVDGQFSRDGIAPGDYTLILKVDAGEVVAESDEADNVVREDFTLSDLDAPCDIAVEVLGVDCDDAETPTDPADDEYTVEVLVTNGEAAGTWEYTTPSPRGGLIVLARGAYGEPFVVDAGRISGSGGITSLFTARDSVNPTCRTSFDLDDFRPSTCSGGGVGEADVACTFAQPVTDGELSFDREFVAVEETADGIEVRVVDGFGFRDVQQRRTTTLTFDAEGRQIGGAEITVQDMLGVATVAGGEAGFTVSVAGGDNDGAAVTLASPFVDDAVFQRAGSAIALPDGGGYFLAVSSGDATGDAFEFASYVLDAELEVASGPQRLADSPTSPGISGAAEPRFAPSEEGNFFVGLGVGPATRFLLVDGDDYEVLGEVELLTSGRVDQPITLRELPDGTIAIASFFDGASDQLPNSVDVYARDGERLYGYSSAIPRCGPDVEIGGGQTGGCESRRVTTALLRPDGGFVGISNRNSDGTEIEVLGERGSPIAETFLPGITDVVLLEIAPDASIYAFATRDGERVFLRLTPRGALDCDDVGPDLADLVIDDLELTVGILAPGEVLRYVFDLANVGQADAGSSFTIGAYLSTDEVIDAGDVRDGSFQTGNFSAGLRVDSVIGASSTAGLATGEYFLILRADDGNAINEGNETNNLAVVPFTIGGDAGTLTYDLELTATSADPTPDRFAVTPVTYTVTNTGVRSFDGELSVLVYLPEGTVFEGGNEGSATAGRFSPRFAEAGLWLLSSLPPGESESVTVNIYALEPEGFVAYAQVARAASSNGLRDPDSTPGNGDLATAREDDEVALDLRYDASASRAALTVSPSVTPVGTTVRVQLRGVATDQRTDLVVSDLSGRIALRRSVDLLTGDNVVEFGTGELAPGVYVIGAPHTEVTPVKLMVR